MTSHSRLSPSSRHRWQLCPGSVREEAKYPDISSKASIDGTHTHTLLEKCLDSGGDASTYIGAELSDHDGTFVVDAARAERVQIALGYIRERVGDSGAIITERRVHPSKTTGRDDLSGTVDVQILQPDGKLIEVIDYKDGMSPVEAKGNPQLEQYALGVIDDNNLPQDCVIRMTIIQPKLAIKGLPVITSHDMTVKELREVVAPKLVLEAAATDDPNAPLVPGDVQCKHCKHKSCSTRATWAMESAGVVFQPINEQSEYDMITTVAQQSANKDPTTMTNEQLRELLEAAPLMRQMLDAAEEEALNRAKAGQTVPGYKVVYGPGSRDWEYAEEQMASKLVKLGIPKKSVYVTKFVSPAQAEKLVWEKKGVKASLSKGQIERMNKEYVTKNKGKLILVPESDPRTSAFADAAPLFSPVTQDLPSWLK